MEANFAFALYKNDFSRPLNLSEIEDYVQITATIEKVQYIDN